MAAPASKSEILDVNRRYHDVAAQEYDAKWGISFAPNGQEQVVGKLSKLLGARPGPFARSLEIGAGTGYFSLNMLQAGVVGARHVHRHLAGHAHHARGERGQARPGRGDRRLRRGGAAVRGRELRPGLRPRRAAPPARARALVRRVPSRAAARRDALLRRRALAPGRQDRRATQARGVAHLARLARRAAGAQGAAPERPCDGGRRRPPPRGAGRRARVRPRPTSSASPPARASSGCACAARSCWPTGSAGSTARWRPAPTRRGSRCRGSITRTAATLLLQGVDRALLEGRLPPQLFYNLMLAATKPDR